MQYDDEIVSLNAEWLAVYLDISKDLTPVGTKTEFDNGMLTRKQEQYSTELFVDSRTGKILDFDADGDFDQRLAYGQHTARLEVHVLVDHDEFVREQPDYQPYQFFINGWKNPCNGVPFPLESQLDDRAIVNIDETLRICNDPTA